MNSSFGNNISLSLFGESHGEAIGVVIQGLGSGIPLDLDYINHQLDLRKPQGKISTPRREADQFTIISGYFNGFTTGSPLCLTIPNQVQASRDYDKTKSLLRPGHADFTAYEKYQGFQDYRGGGHFSGRLTAPLVAAGAVFLQILSAHGIAIGTHIAACAGIKDQTFTNYQTQIQALNQQYFPTISLDLGQQMQIKIEDAAKEQDSVGGILETAVIGMPTGIGNPFFDSIESLLSHLLFSIPGVKAVEFGAGFGFAAMRGSQANDSFVMADDKIQTATNHNGGVNGGITNGMPIIIKTAVKPTPSILQPQKTVDYATKENTEIQITGRHDPAIIHRARVVADSLIAFGLLDLLTAEFGKAYHTIK